LNLLDTDANLTTDFGKGIAKLNISVATILFLFIATFHRR